MNKYEAMFILKPDLSEEERKNLCSQISDTVAKNKGTVKTLSLWQEKRDLYFAIKRHRQGIYYLMQFSLEPTLVQELKHLFAINENILRVLITKIE